MKKIFASLAMTLMAFFVIGQNQSPCDNPKAHEFDFWIGEWTVYKNGTDVIVGYNTVIPVAGGCGLQENWKAANGSNVGTSLNKYAFRKAKWQQFWIDNSGQTLELEGNYADNKMIMLSEPQITDKPLPVNRITWFNNADGTVRQLWEQSKDDGKTWTIAFDGLYKKAK